MGLTRDDLQGNVVQATRDRNVERVGGEARRMRRMTGVELEDDDDGDDGVDNDDDETVMLMAVM